MRPTIGSYYLFMFSNYFLTQNSVHSVECMLKGLLVFICEVNNMCTELVLTINEINKMRHELVFLGV